MQETGLYCGVGVRIVGKWGGEGRLAVLEGWGGEGDNMTLGDCTRKTRCMSSGEIYGSPGKK